MQTFVLIGYDVPDSAQKRAELRPVHLARLQKLHDENRLLLAGPTPTEHGSTTMSGSVIVAKFDDLQQAQNWADAEPYLHGVYSHIELRPFIPVFTQNPT